MYSTWYKPICNKLLEKVKGRRLRHKLCSYCQLKCITVCPRSSDPSYIIVTYFIKWVTLLGQTLLDKLNDKISCAALKKGTGKLKDTDGRH